MKDSKNLLKEARIISRGEAFLTPMQHYHIEEMADIIHPANIKEIIEGGYSNIHEALSIMYDNTDSYVCRNADGDIIFVGGLWYYENSDVPQMFVVFANNVSSNILVSAKMSKALLNMFELSHNEIAMNILCRHEDMLNWACWLGFTPMWVNEETTHVHFVRCNNYKNSVSNKTSRPVVH